MMFQMSKTTKTLFIYALIFMLFSSFMLFGFNIFYTLTRQGFFTTPAASRVSLQGNFLSQANAETINIALILVFLFSVVFFIITMNFYVDERTKNIEHKYIKAKEVTLKRPLNLAKGNIIKMKDYVSLATLSNTKRIPLLKYVFNEKTVFYYLVEPFHIYLFKEYRDTVKRFLEENKL